MTLHSRQHGVALLAAIILVALATTLAVAIGFNTAMTARRGAGTAAMEQGLQLALGAEALAAYVLKEDLRQGSGGSSPNIDSAGDAWNQPFGPVEVVPGVALEAKLDDEQGRFNLNTLLQPDGTPDTHQVETFKMLLRLLQLEERWADLLVDWLDKDPSVFGDGGEDNLYTGLQPGYRPLNELITSTSELMQLPDFGRERYLRLAPHVTALPATLEARTINVCLATPVVLDALISAARGSLDQGFMNEDPQQFAKQREAGCYPGVNAMRSAAGSDASKFDAPAPNLPPRIGEQSTYFRLRTWVTIGTTRFALYSLMERRNQQVQTLLRSFATD